MGNDVRRQTFWAQNRWALPLLLALIIVAIVLAVTLGPKLKSSSAAPTATPATQKIVVTATPGASTPTAATNATPGANGAPTATPANGQGYGLRLDDGTPTHLPDPVVAIEVDRSGGNTVVDLWQESFTSTTGTFTLLASQTLTPAQLAGNNQIEFDLVHSVNSTMVSGDFALGIPEASRDRIDVQAILATAELSIAQIAEQYRGAIRYVAESES